MSFDERFWSRVRTSPTGCWLWQGSCDPCGYGTVGRKGKTYGTHRFAWRQAHGEIPRGKHVLHRCDTPACCRPSHLFLGTPLDNQRDRKAKGRPGSPGAKPGEGHGRAKLTDEAVRAIRREHASGVASYRALATRHGVSFSAIQQVVERRTWTHVTDEQPKGRDPR